MLAALVVLVTLVVLVVSVAVVPSSSGRERRFFALPPHRRGTKRTTDTVRE